MRTIKYRGKRANGEWVYGYPFYNYRTQQWAIHCDASMEALIDREFEVLPETIGQFTEVYDKHFNEIYEGDILKWPSGYRDETADKDSYGDYPWVKCEGFGAVGYREIGGFTNLGHYNGKGGYEAEIVGNIHDNPEILEDESK